MSISIEITGKYACFSRPELKVERVSYEVITPSAARGIVEAVFWKPAIRWVIDEIRVCNPIVFETIRRNELKSKASKQTPYIAASSDRTQRASLILKDVRYVVTAHFELTDQATDLDNEGKFADMIKRRLKKGQFFHKPYLGVREFPADIRLLEKEEELPSSIEDSRSLGLMLYDIDFLKNENGDVAAFNPTYFVAEMQRGVIDLRGVEVLR